MGLPKIGAVLALDGEREYKSAISGINMAQRSLRAEMKLATENFYEQANGIDALTVKQDILERQQEAQKEKVEVCRQALAKYTLAQEEAGKKVEAATENVRQAETRLTELKNSTGATTEEIRKQEKTVQEARAQLETANREYETASKKETEWKISLTNATAELVKTDRAIEENTRYLSEAEKATDGCATSIDEYGKRTKEAGEAADEFKQKTTNAITSLSAILSAGKLTEEAGKLTNLFLNCADAAKEFESAVAKVSTIADSNAVPMEKMSKDILEVSSSLGVAASQIAEASYNAISAGQDTENAVSFAEKATKLSIGGFTDASTAVDILTTALNAYGLEAEKAESISDMLVTTQNLGKTTVAELAATMGRVIPLASSYSVEMDNLSSAYAIMTANGIATAETTTYLKSMLNELGDSGSTVAGVLQEKTGKTFAQLSKEGYSLGDVMGVLGDSVGDDTTKFNELWSSSEAGIGALSLLNSGTAKYNSTLKQMQGSTGATTAAYEKMANTTEMAETRMKNSFDNLKIAVGDTLNPSLEEAYNLGTDLSEWAADVVEEHPEVVKAVAAVSTGVTAFAGSLTVATTAMKGFEMIKALVSPTSLLATALIGVTAAAVTFIAGMNAEETGLQKVNSETKDLIKSSKELNKAQTEATTERTSSRQNMETEAAACQSLAKELIALQGKTNLTASEQSRMQMIVEELNQAMPDLNLAIDEQTGKLNMSSEALQENVEAMNQLAIAAAAQEDLKEIAEQQYEQHKKLVELNQQLEEQTKAVTEAEEAYNEALKRTSETGEAGWSEDADQAYQRALEAQKDLTEQIADTQSAYDALGEEWADTNAFIADTEAQNSAASATRELGDAASETGEKVSGSSESICQAYADMGKSIRESVEEQMDIFSEYEKENSISGEKLLNNMESQVEGVKSWGDNLNELAGRADENGALISEGLLSHLVDLGPEGAAYVETFVNMTDEQLREANELWAESVKLPESIAEQFQETGTQMAAGLAAGITENAPAVEEAMGDSVQGAVDAGNKTAEVHSPSKKTMKTGTFLVEGLTKGIKDRKNTVDAAMREITGSVLSIGKQELAPAVGAGIGQQFSAGLASGIRAGKSDVIRAAVEVAKAAADAARGELGIHSPSKVTQELGGYYMDGWILGIRARTENLKDAVRGALSDSLVQGAEAPMRSGVGLSMETGNGGAAEGRTIQIYFQPQQMTREELDMAFEYVNERFGDALA